MSIRNRIKQAREALGISEAEVARRAGMSPQNLNRFMNGDYADNKHIPEIAKALGVDVVWLTTGAGNVPPWAVSTTSSTIVIQGGSSEAPVIGTVGGSDGRSTAGLIFTDPEIKKLPKGLGMFQVYGNSAYPVIYEEQYALIDASKIIHHNNICVVFTDEHTGYVKRVCFNKKNFKDLEPDDVVILASLDGGKDSWHVTRKDIWRVWPVVGVLF